MAKDPAYLFYSSDFLIGTADLTIEERGYFITLMCLQHQKGRLSAKTIWLFLGLSLVMKFDDFDIKKFIPESVLKKFEIDENGNYYNKRLDSEISKRAEFTNSRKANGAKGGRPKKPKQNLEVKLNETYEEPKKNLHENENENENINVIIDSLDIFTAPEIEKVFTIYKTNCHDLIGIQFERREKDTREKVKEFLRVIQLDFSYFENVCKKANKLKQIANTKLDFAMVLNNHKGIFNDKYDNPEETSKNADGTPKLNWGGI